MSRVAGAIIRLCRIDRHITTGVRLYFLWTEGVVGGGGGVTPWGVLMPGGQSA